MFIQIVEVTSEETEKNLANSSMEGWTLKLLAMNRDCRQAGMLGGLQRVAARTIARGQKKDWGEGGGEGMEEGNRPARPDQAKRQIPRSLIRRRSP